MLCLMLALGLEGRPSAFATAFASSVSNACGGAEPDAVCHNEDYQDGTRKADAPFGTTTCYYDERGNLAVQALPNQVTNWFAHDSLNRLTNVVAYDATTTRLTEFAYRRDAAGNRTNDIEYLATHERSLDYHYDKLNRLLTETAITNLNTLAPKTMPRPHEHHILYKKGIGKSQQELVQEGQVILRKYDIDPIKGGENLIQAPNIKGQHTIGNLDEVVQRLKDADAAGAMREDIVDVLREMGEKAAQRR